MRSNASRSMWLTHHFPTLRTFRCASLPLQGRVKQSRSRDAPGIRVFVQPVRKRASNGREALHFFAPKKRREAERRKTQTEAVPSGTTAAPAGAARLPALHRGSRQQPVDQLAQLQAMLPGTWRNVQFRKVEPVFRNITRQVVNLTGVTRLHLSQSRDCTSHTGHSAGVNDARSRPGAECKSARGHRSRSVFRCASRTRPSPRARCAPLFTIPEPCQGIKSAWDLGP